MGKKREKEEGKKEGKDKRRKEEEGREEGRKEGRKMHGWSLAGSSPRLSGYSVSCHEGAVCWTSAPDLHGKVFTWVCSCLVGSWAARFR